MVDTVGLLGVLLALAGTVVVANAMLSMRNLVNSTRPEGQKFSGFFLSPSTSRPVRKAFRENYPGHSLSKRVPFGAALIVFGMILVIATNTYNAHHL